MSSIQKIIPHYTYDDWVHWEGQWELHEGHPIAMSPTPVPKHQLVAAEIKTELNIARRKANCKNCRVYDGMDYKISEDTILVPDALIVCGEISKKFLDFAPALVVEILSPSTALRDRNTKYQLYERQGVKYYLIIDIDKKMVEAYELRGKEYSLIHPPYEFTLEEGCIIKPSLTTIFE